MQREGGCAVVRQGHCLVIMVAALVVAVLYLSPAYAQQLPLGVPRDTAGQPPPAHVVEAGTPVTVLGRYHGPDPNCPPRPRPCKPYTWVVVQLPNENVVLLPPLGQLPDAEGALDLGNFGSTHTRTGDRNTGAVGHRRRGNIAASRRGCAHRQHPPRTADASLEEPVR
jgi:hypothetical protein